MKVEFNFLTQDNFKNLKLCNEPYDISFPKADLFTRVLNIVMLLFESNCTAKDIAEKLEVVNRQGHYYLDAANIWILTIKQKKEQITNLLIKLMKFFA